MHIFTTHSSYITVLKFNKVNFTSIHSSGTGTCLYALSSGHDSRTDYVQVVMENIIADKNYKFQPSFKNSLFAIQNVGSLLLLGSSSFTNNFGSVFYVQNAKIVLDGLLNFTNNFAYIGSAFHVIGSSWFVLNESLKANFTGNSAMTIWRSNICIQ